MINCTRSDYRGGEQSGEARRLRRSVLVGKSENIVEIFALLGAQLTDELLIPLRVCHLNTWTDGQEIWIYCWSHKHHQHNHSTTTTNITTTTTMTTTTTTTTRVA